MANVELWILFFCVSLTTFLIRLSFVQLHGQTEELMQRLKPVLALLPPAILAALCIPSLLFTLPLTEYDIFYTQVVASIVAIVITRFTDNVFWPVLGGMLTLWFLNWAAF